MLWKLRQSTTSHRIRAPRESPGSVSHRIARNRGFRVWRYTIRGTSRSPGFGRRGRDDGTFHVRPLLQLQRRPIAALTSDLAESHDFSPSAQVSLNILHSTQLKAKLSAGFAIKTAGYS